MATAKINGTLYSVPPNVVGSGAGGNGGSVAKANDSSLLDGVEVSRYDGGVFASTVIDGDDADKVLLSGTFAYNNKRPIATKTTRLLNDSAKDLYNILLGPTNGSNGIDSIHYARVCPTPGNCQDGVRTRRLTKAIREGKWNEFTGEFDATYPENAVDIFEADAAANPMYLNRQYPGQLTYKGNGPLPVSKEYPEKTG